MSWREAYISEAIAIGNRLAEGVITCKDEATWFHRAVLHTYETAPIQQFPRLTASDPSLYSGTAGMALFFARLSQFSNDKRHAQIAQMAMRHALNNAFNGGTGAMTKMNDEWRYGHYVGALGIAWTASEVGTLTDVDFSKAVALIFQRVNRHGDGPCSLDLLHGVAGGILDLLALDHLQPGAASLAGSLGQRLLDAAIPGPAGSISWPSGENQTHPNLTGLSHGTTGMALALASLATQTGEDSFREAAANALAYEDQTYQAHRNNWPHFQLQPEPTGEYPCATAWCHGAPGIGLARVRLGSLHSSLQRPNDIHAAYQTTSRALDEAMREPGMDMQICHGVGGLIEATWQLGDATAEGQGSRLAREAMDLAILRYGQDAYARWGSGAEWPCATTVGPYASLITGTAGIGHLMLQLAFPARVPTASIPPLPEL